MTNPFASTLEIIRARNVIAYPFDKTDDQLREAANVLLRYSDNGDDYRNAQLMMDRVKRNAIARQSEALQGFDLYVQPVTKPSTGYTFWAACAVIFGTVGYIIGAVTQ